MPRVHPNLLANYLTVGDAAAIDITGQYFSMGIWWITNSIGGFKDQWGKHAGPSNTYQYGCWLNGSGYLMFIGNGGSTVDGLDAVTSTVIGRWYKTMLVKNGGVLRVYADGKLVNHASSATTIGNTANALLIGRNNNAGSGQWDGQLAHAAIWSDALTDDEACAYTMGRNPLFIRPQALRGYWPLDNYEPSGVARDHSRFANHATMVNSISLGAAITPQSLPSQFTVPDSYMTMQTMVGAQLFAGGIISG